VLARPGEKISVNDEIGTKNRSSDIDLGGSGRYYLGFVALTPCASESLGDVAERSKALPC